MNNEERFVIQGPDQSGFAGPWSIWDSLMSTFNGSYYVDDPVVTGLKSKDDAKQAVGRICILVGGRKIFKGEHNGKKLGGYVSGPHKLIRGEDKHNPRVEHYFGVSNHYGGGSVGICSVDILDIDSEHSVESARKTAQSIADAFDVGVVR